MQPKVKPEDPADKQLQGRIKRGKSPRVLHHEGPHTCDLCGTICENRPSMHDNMRYKHLTAPRFFCDLCPKSFTLKSHLSSHMKTHMELKEHVFDVCNFMHNSTILEI